MVFDQISGDDLVDRVVQRKADIVKQGDAEAGQTSKVYATDEDDGAPGELASGVGSLLRLSTDDEKLLPE